MLKLDRISRERPGVQRGKSTDEMDGKRMGCVHAYRRKRYPHMLLLPTATAYSNSHSLYMFSATDRPRRRDHGRSATSVAGGLRGRTAYGLQCFVSCELYSRVGDNLAEPRCIANGGLAIRKCANRKRLTLAQLIPFPRMNPAYPSSLYIRTLTVSRGDDQRKTSLEK